MPSAPATPHVVLSPRLFSVLCDALDSDDEDFQRLIDAQSQAPVRTNPTIDAVRTHAAAADIVTTCRANNLEHSAAFEAAWRTADPQMAGRTERAVELDIADVPAVWPALAETLAQAGLAGPGVGTVVLSDGIMYDSFTVAVNVSGTHIMWATYV